MRRLLLLAPLLLLGCPPDRSVDDDDALDDDDAASDDDDAGPCGLVSVVESRAADGTPDDVFATGDAVVLFAGIRNDCGEPTTRESNSGCLVGSWLLESTAGQAFQAPIGCDDAITPFTFPPGEVVGETWIWEGAEEGDWTLTPTYGTGEPVGATAEFRVVVPPGR